MGGKRLERLESQLVREVSDILLRKLSDPRLQWVTVTRAKLTPDLREARLFITTLQGGEARAQALAALEHAHGYIRRELGRRLQLRITPDVHFAEDEDLARVEKIERILNDLKREEGTTDG